MEINGQQVTEIKRYDEMGLSPEIMKAQIGRAHV